MKDEIITYREMCDNEGVQTIQRGMNYRLNSNYSVILMSQRSNAPYNDKILADDLSIEYEGHDLPKSVTIPNPKLHDQPKTTSNGRLTQNGLFAKAVDDSKSLIAEPEIVRVYEKLFNGVWSEKGFFKLIDYRYERDATGRFVYKFVLEEAEVDFENDRLRMNKLRPRSRLIPSHIKKEVWSRDKGRCVICGAADELHFDHDLPYSKGGASITAENVRILCARHNLEKSGKIQ